MKLQLIGIPQQADCEDFACVIGRKQQPICFSG